MFLVKRATILNKKKYVESEKRERSPKNYLCAVTRRLRRFPPRFSSLKKLEELELVRSRLSSLPKELGDLSRLTKLDLSGNKDLGKTPEGEALPAELKEAEEDFGEKPLAKNPTAEVAC